MSFILIVEDDDDNRGTLKEVLAAEGFAVREAKDGIEALEALSAAGVPALILLDWRMPRMDGWQFLDWLGSRPELSRVPVVLISADSRPVGHERVAVVLRKPYDLDTLLRLASAFSRPVD